jgi:signal peptidase
MEPAIKTGSIIIVKQTSINQISKGDVVSFVSNGLPVTHRVFNISSDKTKIVSKGDANPNPDIDLVKPDSIQGKVLFSIPFLGYLSVWIKTPLGFYILVIIPAILIVANEIWNIKNTIQNLISEKSGHEK